MSYNGKQILKRKLSGSLVKIYNSIGEACRENKIAEHYMRSQIREGKLFIRDHSYEKVK